VEATEEAGGSEFSRVDVFVAVVEKVRDAIGAVVRQFTFVVGKKN
jgi:hypothetical protein